MLVLDALACYFPCEILLQKEGGPVVLKTKWQTISISYYTAREKLKQYLSIVWKRFKGRC